MPPSERGEPKWSTRHRSLWLSTLTQRALQNAPTIGALAGLAGLAIYALLQLVDDRFYSNIGLRPSDVGLGYGEVLGQSVTTLVGLASASFIWIAFGLLVAIAAVIQATVVVGLIYVVLPNRIRASVSSVTLGIVVSIASLATTAVLTSLQHTGTFGVPVPWQATLIVSYAIPLTATALLLSAVARWGIGADRIAWMRTMRFLLFVRAVLPLQHLFGVLLTTLFTFCAAVWVVMLFVAADQYAESLSRCRVRELSIGPVQTLPWTVESARVYWSTDAPPELVREHENYCYVYLGHEGGTTILYGVSVLDRSKYEVLRVSDRFINLGIRPPGAQVS